MRTAILLLFILPSLLAQTRPDIWKQVNPEAKGASLQDVRPIPARLAALAKLRLIKQLSPNSPSADQEGCDLDTPAGLLQGLTFREIPLARHHDILLVGEQGPCAWGGTGGGGDQWLIQFDGTTPIILASPKDGFIGWIYSIQPSASHGYHDLVLGWHMAADDYNLVYFRFDGKSYIVIGRANETAGEIVPNK